MDYSGPSYIRQASTTPDVVWSERPAVQRAPDQAPGQAPTQAPPTEVHTSPAAGNVEGKDKSQLQCGSWHSVIQYSAASTLPFLSPVTVAQDERGVGGDESFSESLSKDVFSTYKCRSIKHGIEHPGDIAEASGLRY
jgi:hypothetical protein